MTIKNVMKAMHTPTGSYAISFLLGIGLASLFRKVCKDRNCLVFKAPSMDEVTKNVYQYADKCYKFNASSAQKCGQKQQTLEFV